MYISWQNTLTWSCIQPVYLGLAQLVTEFVMYLYTYTLRAYASLPLFHGSSNPNSYVTTLLSITLKSSRGAGGVYNRLVPRLISLLDYRSTAALHPVIHNP
jgi:hypothetical protein